MRNAVKRVTHKERAQPSSRKKFGLLEKHKDYVERAKDYKNKQTHLTRLRKKALDRNPDEFYFKMNTSQVRNGIHRIDNNKNAKLDNSVISALKTQDLGYITVKKSSDDSKIRRLKENLHLIGEQKVKSHKIFVATEDEVEDFDSASYFNTAPELVNRSFNRPKLLTSRSSGSADSDPATAEYAEGSIESANTEVNMIDPRCVATSLAVSSSSKKKSKAIVPAAYRELRERVKRSKKLRTAIEDLSLRRNLTNSKGSKRKYVVAADGSVTAKSAGGEEEGSGKKGASDSKEKVIYKWKRQRAN